LLIAYEETTPHQVKPVVSDLDCFVVGARGKQFNSMPDEQVQLIRWELDNIEAMLRKAYDDKKRAAALERSGGSHKSDRCAPSSHSPSPSTPRPPIPSHPIPPPRIPSRLISSHLV
jgi:hypothetical protein